MADTIVTYDGKKYSGIEQVPEEKLTNIEYIIHEYYLSSQEILDRYSHVLSESAIQKLKENAR